MIPTANDVLVFLGTPEEGQHLGQLNATLTTAQHMVKAYTRGRGFTGIEPADDLAAVIVSCAARLYRNPTLDRQQTAGPFSQQPGTFAGWTLAELAILNNYRVRAR